jgi:hypothetical protein
MVKYTLIQICGRCGGPVSKHYADCPIVLMAEIERLRAALLDGVCMLSEMGLDPREKCQMAYDHLSAALAEEKPNDR